MNPQGTPDLTAAGLPFAPVPIWPPTLQPIEAKDYPTAPAIPGIVYEQLLAQDQGRAKGPLTRPFASTADEVASYQPRVGN